MRGILFECHNFESATVLEVIPVASFLTEQRVVTAVRVRSTASSHRDLPLVTLLFVFLSPALDLRSPAVTMVPAGPFPPTLRPRHLVLGASSSGTNAARPNAPSEPQSGVDVQQRLV
jgi:hypothetical protein